jgi:hypothetical protein
MSLLARPRAQQRRGWPALRLGVHHALNLGKGFASAGLKLL